MDTTEKIKLTCLPCLTKLESEGEQRFQRTQYDLVPSRAELQHKENMRRIGYSSLAVLSDFRPKPSQPRFGFNEIGLLFSVSAVVSVVIIQSAPVAQSGASSTPEFLSEFLIWTIILSSAGIITGYIYSRFERLPKYQARYKAWRDYYTCQRCGELQYRDHKAQNLSERQKTKLSPGSFKISG